MSWWRQRPTAWAACGSRRETKEEEEESAFDLFSPSFSLFILVCEQAGVLTPRGNGYFFFFSFHHFNNEGICSGFRGFQPFGYDLWPDRAAFESFGEAIPCETEIKNEHSRTQKKKKKEILSFLFSVIKECQISRSFFTGESLEVRPFPSDRFLQKSSLAVQQCPVGFITNQYARSSRTSYQSVCLACPAAIHVGAGPVRDPNNPIPTQHFEGNSKELTDDLSNSRLCTI